MRTAIALNTQFRSLIVVARSARAWTRSARSPSCWVAMDLRTWSKVVLPFAARSVASGEGTPAGEAAIGRAIRSCHSCTALCTAFRSRRPALSPWSSSESVAMYVFCSVSPW